MQQTLIRKTYNDNKRKTEERSRGTNHQHTTHISPTPQTSRPASGDAWLNALEAIHGFELTRLMLQPAREIRGDLRFPVPSTGRGLRIRALPSRKISLPRLGEKKINNDGMRIILKQRIHCLGMAAPTCSWIFNNARTRNRLKRSEMAEPRNLEKLGSMFTPVQDGDVKHRY